MSDRARWHIVHTYSGYEDKAKANLEKTIENRNLESLILDVRVPVEESAGERDGKIKVTLKKRFPGYVMVNVVMTNESWYVIRNTRGVTGFVGPGSKPVLLTGEEVESMGVMKTTMGIDLEVGKIINIISGALNGLAAIIQKINVKKDEMKALVDMFDRKILVELDFNQVEKLD